MLLRFIFSAPIFMVFTVASYGQMMPMQRTMSTPYGNVSTTYYVPSPTMYYGRSGNSNVSLKYEFFVVLKNDSVISGRARIELSKDLDHSITIKNKKQKLKTQVYPKDTKLIYRYNITNAVDQRAGVSHVKKELLEGIPADSCWLFKTYTGKINAYSFLAEPGLVYAIAIQEGEKGPIVPLTKENLEFIIGTEDPKLYKLIEKKSFAKAIEMYNKK